MQAVGGFASGYKAEMSGQLSKACDEQLSRLTATASAGASAASAPSSSSLTSHAAASEGVAGSDPRRMGLLIEAQLRRCAAVPPLVQLTLAACGQAVSVFGNRAETLVRWSDASASAAGVSRGLVQSQALGVLRRERDTQVAKCHGPCIGQCQGVNGQLPRGGIRHGKEGAQGIMRGRV